DFDPATVEGPATVNLTLANPTGTTLGQTNATLTILEDTSTFNFSATNYSIIEGTSNALVTVTRSGGGPRPASVDFSATNLTAVAGFNFVATNGTLTFAPGQTNATFVVPIIHNNLGEGDKTVLLAL